MVSPRVGGAHVDVDLELDTTSIDRLQARIESQLAKLSKRSSSSFKERFDYILGTARVVVGQITALIPVVASSISALGAAFTALGGSIGNSFKAMYPLVGVVGALGVALGTARVGFQGFGAALEAANPEELAEALKNLSPAARESALAVRGLSGVAEELRRTVQQKMFAGLASEISNLEGTLFPALQSGMGNVATALNQLFSSLLRYTSSKSGVQQISDALNNSAVIFGTLSTAAVPALDGILRLFNALEPAATRMAGRISDLATRFQEWTTAEGFVGRVDAQMKSAEKSAGLLLTVIGNLGGALSNVFSAATPAGDRFLTMLAGVTQRFQDWTGSVGGQNAIAEWAQSGVDVMEQLGATLSEFGTFFAAAVNPGIVTGILAALEQMFVALNKLPLEEATTAVANFLQENSKLVGIAAAVAVGFSAISTIIGYVAVAVGGLVTAFGGLSLAMGSVKRVGNVFKGMSSAKGTSGLIKTLVANFKSLSGILSKGLRFAGIAGIAIWIGTIIAKSEELRGKVSEVFSAIGGVFSSLGGALSGIYTSLQPVFDLLSRLTPVFEFLIGLILDGLVMAFQALGNVITGVGQFISGFITVITGLFTALSGGGWSGVVEGLKTMFSGIVNIVKGAFVLIMTFFAPARLFGLASRAFMGLFRGIKGAMPAIRGAAGSVVQGILSSLLKLPGKLYNLALRAFVRITNAIGTALPGILSSAGRIVTGVVKFIGRLPGRLFSLGVKAVTRLASAVRTGIGKLRSIAGNIVSAVVQYISTLPGKLRTQGIRAVTRLASAVRTGIGKLRSIASSIVSAVVQYISRLPGRLRSQGMSAVSSLASAVRTGIGRLRSIASSIVSAVVSYISRLPGRLRSAGSSAVSSLASAFGNAVGRMRSVASRIVSTVVSTVSSLPGKMVSIGSRIVGSIASGILGGIGKVTGALGSIASKVRNFFPGSPVQEGPLREWNYGSGASGAGRTLMSDLTKGLESQIGGLIKASSRAAEAFKSPFQLPVLPQPLTAGSGQFDRPQAAVPQQVNYQVEVNLLVEDLDKISTVNDFVNMLGDSRVNSRKTLRSGKVAF